MEVCKDATDPQIFEEAKDRTTQIVLAVYCTVFSNLIDEYIVKTGHEAFMATLHPEQVKEFMKLSAMAKAPEELIKPLCKLYGVIPTYDKKDYMYLKLPLSIGMSVAKLVFKVK